jgi:hypothetical protein
MIDPERQPTFTGKQVNPFDIRPEDICIEDIAHHLSLACRYNGAVPYHYSVAQHALLVADILMLHGAPPIVECAGLHHDDSETWLGDVTTPIKRDPMSEGYRGVESRAMRVVETVFGLPYGSTEADIVKWADNEALEREWWSLIEPNGLPTPPGVTEMRPRNVEDAFLLRAATLDRLIAESAFIGEGAAPAFENGWRNR